MTAKDRPVSKPATDAFRDGHDRIFGGEKLEQRPPIQVDAEWVMTFLRGIESSGKHAPTEAMQRVMDGIATLINGHRRV